MPMDRPHRWFAASCGLLLLVSSSGCRSTKTRIPPEPRAGAGRPSQVQFSSDPSPPTNMSGLGTNAPGLANPGMSSGLMGGANPALGGAGAGSGANRGDVPLSGLGNPASGNGGAGPRVGEPNAGLPPVSDGPATQVTLPGPGDAMAKDRAPSNGP
jgi:hypothetical protein